MRRSSRTYGFPARRAGRLVALAILLPLLSAVASAQSMYKSVGPDGRIAYSDSPPAKGRIAKTLKFESAPASPLPAYYLETLRKLRTSAASSAALGDVVLYSAAWCAYCKKAKAYLGGKGIAYQEIDIDTSEGMAAFAQVGGGKGIPLLVTASQRIQGFSTASYDGLFNKQP